MSLMRHKHSGNLGVSKKERAELVVSALSLFVLSLRANSSWPECSLAAQA